MTPAEYAKQHQKAFRTAFDFLNAHFPPENDLVWWEKLAKDCSDASVEAGENKLVIGLLIAVTDYLEEVRKERKDNG